MIETFRELRRSDRQVFRGTEIFGDSIKTRLSDFAKYISSLHDGCLRNSK